MNKEAPARRHTYRVLWHVREYALSGVAYFESTSEDAAIEALKAKVMREHDMMAVIDSCVIDDWRA